MIANCVLTHCYKDEIYVEHFTRTILQEDLSAVPQHLLYWKPGPATSPFSVALSVFLTLAYKLDLGNFCKLCMHLQNKKRNFEWIIGTKFTSSYNQLQVTV